MTDADEKLVQPLVHYASVYLPSHESSSDDVRDRDLDLMQTNATHEGRR